MKAVSGIFLTVLVISFLIACPMGQTKPAQSTDQTPTQPTLPDEIILSFSRINSGTYNPFTVTALVRGNGIPLSNVSLTLAAPKGTSSAIVNNGDGTYSFTVTPSSSGVFPVTVTGGEISITREALVLPAVLSGAGQAQLVSGDVNTEGYEDGITITPDGQYLFVQYGPLYFSGILLHSQILSKGESTGFSIGYDLLAAIASQDAYPDSNWVFDTIGPYASPLRPSFPTGAISGGKLTHMQSVVIPNVANGIVMFPTVFYGFKRQADGSFREPFKVSFDDSRGTNGPFGISFYPTGIDTAGFAVSWNNYFSELGDDKPDIYAGTITFGSDASLGTVEYSGEFFASITPNIAPVSFTSHVGVQGNPHLYYSDTGTVTSIWTDDEQVAHDLSVYCLTSGTYPNGEWSQVTLPEKINTADSESQPFFTGTRLYLNRATKIVYHEYSGTPDGAGYASNSNWGDEVIVLSSGEIGIGTIFGVGEPTICSHDGKTYLYFAYIESRAQGIEPSRYDYDLGAAFIEL